MPQTGLLGDFTGDGGPDEATRLAARRYIDHNIGQGFARRRIQLAAQPVARDPGQSAEGWSRALGASSLSVDGALAAAKTALKASGKAGAAMAPKALGALEKGNLAANLIGQGLKATSDVQRGKSWDDAVAAAIGRVGADALGGAEGGLIAGGMTGGPGAPIGAFIGAVAADQSGAADKAGDLSEAAWRQIKQDWFPDSGELKGH